jgi:SAM-dependent methyltransferase
MVINGEARHRSGQQRSISRMSTTPDASSYPLHVDEVELQRLRGQHEAWGDLASDLFARVPVRPGMRVLDLGCGPGFVTLELARRVGSQGQVVALDASPMWQAHLAQESQRLGITNIVPVQERFQAVEFAPQSFDYIYARWFWSFVPDPCREAARVARWLAPHGVIALQDYHHEGIALTPPSRGFVAVVRGLRAMYQQHGGDAFVAAKVPAMWAAAGLRALDYTPVVRAGGPTSAVFRWADSFFPRYAAKLRDGGWISADEWEEFVTDWSARRVDASALFWSPAVVTAVAVKDA